MKYKLTAEVEGAAYVSTRLAVQRENLEFEFLPSSDGRLSKVSVCVSVPPELAKSFASKIGPGSGRSVMSITIGGNPELHNRLVSELQAVESNLGFQTLAAVQRIRWDTPTQEYIPECAEDKEILGVTEWSMRQAPRVNRARVPLNLLQNSVLRAPQQEELKVAKAFWREGMIYFNNGQFIQAFYQFYFVIEDFYAHGKSAKAEVLRQFRRSAEFVRLCKDSLEKLLELDRHRQNIERLFSQLDLEQTPEGLQELLFQTRGAVHHYSRKGMQKRGTPFNQSDFESIALLAMHLVTAAIGYQVVRINQAMAQKDKVERPGL